MEEHYIIISREIQEGLGKGKKSEKKILFLCANPDPLGVIIFEITHAAVHIPES